MSTIEETNINLDTENDELALIETAERRYINEDITHRIADNERTSRPYLTKYEKAKLIGIRAKQISMGAKITIDTQGISDVIDIAKKELFEKKTPLIVRRYMPNNMYEDWKISELIF